MRQDVNITTSTKKELKKYPLLFLRYEETLINDGGGHSHINTTWKPVNEKIDIYVSTKDFGDSSLGYCLAYVESLIPNKDDKGEIIPDHFVLSIMDVHGKKATEWKKIIDYYISKDKSATTNDYTFVELLWTLDRLDWDEQSLKDCLLEYPNKIKFSIINELSHIGKCLSVDKQNRLKSVIDSLDGNYDIYVNDIISELYGNSPYPNGLNMFTLLDKILNFDYSKINTNRYRKDNQIMVLLKWINTEEPLADYNILKEPLFSQVSDEMRLLLVKRYLHDIRNNNTNLDIEILRKLKDTAYSEFIRYRHCIETPTEPVVLTVPLLCDSLITLFHSRGQEFQTFDGVLDFAITHCDPDNPNIKFNLQRILPTCEEGAVYNERFEGFVDYSIIATIDEAKLNKNELTKDLISFLNLKCRKKQYSDCLYDRGTPLRSEEKIKCHKSLDSETKKCWKDGKDISKRYCLSYGYYDEIWIISSVTIERDLINNLLSIPIKEFESNKDYELTPDKFSFEAFSNYIKSLFNKFERISEDEFLITSSFYKNYDIESNLIKKYSKKLRMRFYPQQFCRIISNYDLLGVKEKLYAQYKNKNAAPPLRLYEETVEREIYFRTAKSLSKKLGQELSRGGYFEVTYDEALLNNVTRSYYFKSKMSPDDNIEERHFLKKQKPKHIQFCAPKLADLNNSAIDIPFYWCRGTECFHNKLSFHKLSSWTNWKDYSLYHMVEIIGLPQLKESRGMYEPEEAISRFISTTNRVLLQFKRLKCRQCGHLIFTANSLGFNYYNRFGCKNPNCSEYKKLVYLNFCHECKTGLIDSRDSKQCPNGWYICPKCLACCNDDVYNRKAQRYTLNGQPVPERLKYMLDKGHNNKGQYFCVQCGREVKKVSDGHGNSAYVCSNCRTRYDNVGENR